MAKLSPNDVRHLAGRAACGARHPDLSTVRYLTEEQRRKVEPCRAGTDGGLFWVTIKSADLDTTVVTRAKPADGSPLRGGEMRWWKSALAPVTARLGDTSVSVATTSYWEASTARR